MKSLKLIVSVILLVPITTVAQAFSPPAPMVAAAQVPLYPPLARAARIQGDVVLQVTTDGQAVIGTRVQSGHPTLARVAEDNVRTWRFSTHEPITFMATYHYKIVDGLKSDSNNPTVILRLPNEVEVTTAPMPTLE